jgi:glycosyltransferase involved in cell wall biosynthesis
MKISIIITNYNYGKFISSCLKSCFNQSFLKKDYEVILVDDCSNDQSKKKIKKFEHKKNFKFIENKKNLGVAASANIGIKNSNGKYFVRVDADDYVNKNFLKLLFDYIIKKPKILGVSSDYFYFNNNGKKIKKFSYKLKPISCGVLYNKKKLIKYGIYNSKFRHREEEELRKRIGKNYKIMNLEKNLYYYRMHQSNKTKQKKLMNNFKQKLSKLYN